MSDQGTNDTHKPTGTGRSWEHGDKLDEWRDGYWACLETCRATLDGEGIEKLEAYIRRATREFRRDTP